MILKKRILLLVIFPFINFNICAQTCHFTSDGNWDKSGGGGLAGYSCDVGYDPSTATTIYIDPNVTVTIDKQTTDITWQANVIVEGTLVLKTKLILDESPTCDLTLTIEDGGKVSTSNGNGINELLVICGVVVVSNPNGSGLYHWDDFPNGEITGPQFIDDTGGTLPVELTNFSGFVEGDVVKLIWETASELNNDYFTLKRSRNGKVFETIGIIEGNGTVTTTSNYSFTDDHPYLGLSFYRLSQTDYDGTTEVFPMISVLFSPDIHDFTVSPNPVRTSVIHVQSTGKRKNEQLVFTIVDLQGRMLEQRQLIADDYGNLDTDIHLNKNLRKGTYICELASETSREIQKVISE